MLRLQRISQIQNPVRLPLDALQEQLQAIMQCPRKLVSLQNSLHPIQQLLVGNLGRFEHLPRVTQLRKPRQERLAEMFTEFADEMFRAVETVHYRQIFRVLFHQRDPFPAVK